jgi:ubiquinol-cytochrome c reductase cytochrome b/c1 subunit
MSRAENRTTGAYHPHNPFLRWLEKRLPIGQLVYSEFVAYPTPRNLNYWWAFGAILTFMLGAQLATGLVLAMHYTPHADLAFRSVEQIMRDVDYGWLLRYLHSNGASMFFVAVYVHMFRSLYYGSYKEPYELVWILGVIVYLLMVVTGFLGYVLVWGQMSFWAATVITNLFSAIPVVGDSIVNWLWGGYAVGNPTLNRFYSLHYLLPFMIVGVAVVHVWALHVSGQNNPAYRCRPAGTPCRSRLTRPSRMSSPPRASSSSTRGLFSTFPIISAIPTTTSRPIRR